MRGEAISLKLQAASFWVTSANKKISRKGAKKARQAAKTLLSPFRGSRLVENLYPQGYLAL
jgi:hypothetical protein